MEKIKLFKFVDTEHRVNWLKMEVSASYYRRRDRLEDKTPAWTISRTHNMGRRMWAIADTRADIIEFHHDFAGTMYFIAKLYANEEGTANRRAQVSTWDQSSTLIEVPVSAHRISMVPETREGIDSTYRAYFNLMAFEDWGTSERDPAELTKNFMGGNSRTILIGAMQLLGYDVDFADSDFLSKNADLLFENVRIDDFSMFRPERSANGIIPYGENGVRNGDIIVSGDRYLVLVANESTHDEPATGALSGDDHVLDAYNNLVRPTFANVIQLDQEPISIWRLKPLGE